MPKAESFSTRLLRWFDRHGRKNLPWQAPRTAYRVWLSEVMLQQTQVATAIPYFLRFVEKFPTLPMLAAATQDDVLALWSGLGYYSRARNLHRAAQVCVDIHAGALPQQFDKLAALPGIGRSTAGAILAQAHGKRFPILDGNVKRVLARFHGLRGWPGSTAVERQLWNFAETHTPDERLADYTQAVMDLGATLCTRSRPACMDCPLQSDCVAHRDGLTARLPERKPTRVLPTRSTVMLVLRNDRGQLLLERRPPTGVWAQMWSLPEASDAGAAQQRIARDHGLGSGDISLRPLPSFVHTFSHYKLDVTPLTIELHSAARVADNPDQRWLHPADAAALGLPTPVRKLIESFLEQERCHAPCSA